MPKDLSGVRAALDEAHDALTEARSEWPNCQRGPESVVLDQIMNAVAAIHTAVDRFIELDG